MSTRWLSRVTGEFTGMNREECREAVIKWFEEHDLLDHVEDHDHSVMHCYRCDAALEPWLSEQWFVAVDKLKGPALDAVNSGKVTFHPARWTQTYTTWMENLKDWCISRQLWWGHRIPVFYCEDCGWEDALTEDTDVCPKCGGHHVHQDENVLDTWFSSQLWTFATQGWPQKPELLEGHHPTTALVTARDIIALWVARMVMSSLYFWTRCRLRTSSSTRRSWPRTAAACPSPRATASTPWTSSACTAPTRCASTCSRSSPTTRMLSLTRTSTRRPSSSSTARAPSRPSRL